MILFLSGWLDYLLLMWTFPTWTLTNAMTLPLKKTTVTSSTTLFLERTSVTPTLQLVNLSAAAGGPKAKATCVNASRAISSPSNRRKKPVISMVRWSKVRGSYLLHYKIHLLRHVHKKIVSKLGREGWALENLLKSLFVKAN